MASTIQDQEIETARKKCELIHGILDAIDRFDGTKASQAAGNRIAALLPAVDPSGNGRGVSVRPASRAKSAGPPNWLVTPADAAREAIDTLPEPFTMRQVWEAIKKRHPDKPRLYNKKYLSSTLDKLRQQGEIERLPSRGKLNLYRRPPR